MNMHTIEIHDLSFIFFQTEKKKRAHLFSKRNQSCKRPNFHTVITASGKEHWHLRLHQLRANGFHLGRVTLVFVNFCNNFLLLLLAFKI
jgi:hypothetical protein